MSEQPFESNVFNAVTREFEQRTPTSGRLHRDASQWVPGGINRNILHQFPHPLFFRSGSGATLTDVDGNTYIDFNGNYTSLILGHAHPAIEAAVAIQLSAGTAWSGGSLNEAGLAREIAARLPSAQQVRFASSGTEATLLAIRAARAFTGRPLIAKFQGGYHGLHDYVVLDNIPGSSISGSLQTTQGIPQAVISTSIALPFNEPKRVQELVEQHADRLAALIVEPFLGVGGVIAPCDGFLGFLRDLTFRNETLLIFDEVISFRSSWGGAQELYGVTPDLTTLGKIIGGGFPIGAVAGRRDVMRLFDPSGEGAVVGFSGTFHANPIALAAGVAALNELSREVIEALNSRAQLLAAAVEPILRRAACPLAFQHVGSVFNIHAAHEPVTTYKAAARGDKDFLRQLNIALLNQGILLSPRGFGCLSVPMTDDDVARFSSALELALHSLGVLSI